MTLARTKSIDKLGKNTKNGGKITVPMAKTPPPELNFYKNKKQRHAELLPDPSRVYRNSLSPPTQPCATAAASSSVATIPKHMTTRV